MFRSNEQEYFNTLLERHMSVQDAPLLLEGGTGLGKTRAYLAALKGFQGKVAIVLPTHQLIEQLIISSDLKAVGIEVKAFRPRRMFDTQADYDLQKDEASAASVMICTSASVIIDQRLSGGYNGATQRDYILFDEADALPDAAALQKDLEISAFEIKDAGVKNAVVANALNELIDKTADTELKAKARIIREASENPAWYHTVGSTEEGGISLFHRMPGLLLTRIANQKNVAFISATLKVASSFDDFKRSLGINRESRLSDSIDPKMHGDMLVEYPLSENIVTVISGAPKPCLVATTSFQSSEELAALIPTAVLRTRGETPSMAALRVSEDGVLIATGAWAGLDTPRRWASVVVPKVPFGKPVEQDGHIESRYLDSRNVAIRRMRQVLGRGLRTPDAKCTFYICDARYKSLGNFLPERFSKSWWEGGKKTIELSKSERCPAIRKAALKHYGCVCHRCDLRPKNPTIIEVHHLFPIADGTRKTKIEDVIPLCRNCHELAHTENPPIPIDRLKTTDF